LRHLRYTATASIWAVQSGSLQWHAAWAFSYGKVYR